MEDVLESFLGELAKSIKGDTFVKLSLGNYKGSDEHLQKVLVRRVDTKKGKRLYFVYRYEGRDTAKNFDVDLGVSMIGELLDGQFFSAHLFTTERDYQLTIGRKGTARMNKGKPTFASKPELGHDRSKKLQIEPSAFYLKALGIADDNGRIKDKQQDKWRQINKFAEVLASLVDKSDLREAKALKIVDMGSGKGYLTFAAYDYFTNIRGVELQMTGVEARGELVELCNNVAAGAGYSCLTFVVGEIADHEVGPADILIALHACNTATDDALFAGLTANASLIVAAPCCHKEIRPQIRPPEMLRDVLKHGVMLERTAETITDGLRSLLLERSGYDTKLFEFVSTEHTPKNNMLAATRSRRSPEAARFDREIAGIKQFYGIKEQRLESLLGVRSVPADDQILEL